MGEHGSQFRVLSFDDQTSAVWARAREAARARATECGVRLNALLEEGATSSDEDVALAHDRARRALARAVEARTRLSRILQRRHERESLRRLGVPERRQSSVLPSLLEPGSDLRGTSAEVRHALDSGALSAGGLWQEFIACGGSASLMEFDAYLHGAWSMSVPDLRVLEHVWWEREHLT
ncbi:hypothetical protein ACWEOW_17480 [Monashia sp. NPDC004114]